MSLCQDLKACKQTFTFSGLYSKDKTKLQTILNFISMCVIGSGIDAVMWVLLGIL